jgi:hypothetical protein
MRAENNSSWKYTKSRKEREKESAKTHNKKVISVREGSIVCIISVLSIERETERERAAISALNQTVMRQTPFVGSVCTLRALRCLVVTFVCL